jgi:hypothetical protein
MTFVMHKLNLVFRWSSKSHNEKGVFIYLIKILKKLGTNEKGV